MFSLPLRGGSSRRPGTVDYSKWDRLGQDGETEDDAEGAPLGAPVAPRITKLKNPSDVSFGGGGVFIDGDIEGSTHPLPRRTVDDDAEDEAQKRDYASMRESQKQQKSSTRMRDSDSLERSAARAPSSKEDAEGPLRLPKAPEFVLGEELEAGMGGQVEVEEWRDEGGGGWKGVDYSKWDKLRASDSEKESVKEESDDIGGGAEQQTDDDDKRITKNVKADIARAIQLQDEGGLRRALKHADALAGVDLLSPHAMSSAQQALQEMTRARQRLEEQHKSKSKGEEDEDRAGVEAGDPDPLKLARARLESMSKNGGRTSQFLWSQTREEVTLHVLAPLGLKGRDVSVTLGERFIKIAAHRPQEGAEGAGFVGTAARARAKVAHLLRGKLAYRIKAGDGEVTEWEMVDFEDVAGTKNCSVVRARAVKVTLRKKAPGETFFASTDKEWDQDYQGPGTWQASVVRVWWAKVMQTDSEVAVAGAGPRGPPGNSSFQALWDSAAREFNATLRSGMLRPINLSHICAEQRVQENVQKEQAELEREHVPADSPVARMRLEEAKKVGEEQARQEIAGAVEARQRREQEDEELERRLADTNLDGGSTDYNTDGEPIPSPDGRTRFSL